MNLGLVISRQLKTEVTFSKFTFFNKAAGTEGEVESPGDLGPFKPGSAHFLGPWEVPGEKGEYELRVYVGDEVVASALFNVGIWPASWGPEMVTSPAPIHEVRVNTSESEPRVSVYIKGGLPEGCKASHGYSIERIDDTLNIEVFIKHPKDEPCEEVYGFFEETVNFWPDLLRGFTSGETYTVNVNDYTTTFVMP